MAQMAQILDYACPTVPNLKFCSVKRAQHRTLHSVFSISPIIDLLLEQVNKTGTSEDDLDNSVQDLDQSVM